MATKKQIIFGSIPYSIAQKIGRMSADIVLNSEGYEHISVNHGKELRQLGMTVIDFVKFIIDNYNEIRTDNKRALFLIVENKDKDMANAAIIRLNYKEENEKRVYYIETASPFRKKWLSKKELLWKGTHPLD